MDPYIVFDGKKKTMKIYDDNNSAGNYKDDKLLGTFKAHNNVTSSSKGKWEDGKYDMDSKKERVTHTGNDKDGIPLDSKNGSYGEGGSYRAKNFKETTTTETRTGMSVHAGREDKNFEDRKTEGCVRTTPDGMKAIDNAIDEYGDLQNIIIQNNRESKNSSSVNAIKPGNPLINFVKEIFN